MLPRIYLGTTTKIVLFVGMTVILCISAVSFWTHYLFNTRLVEEKLKELGTLAHDAGIRFESTLNELKHDVRTLAAMPSIQGIIRAQQNNGIDPLDGSTEQIWRERLVTTFTATLTGSHEYSQIRYIWCC